MKKFILLLAVLSLFPLPAVSGLPKTPSSFENKIISKNKKTTKESEVIQEEKITFALSEGINVKAPRPITVRIYDKNFINEVNRELKNKDIRAENIVVKGVVEKVENKQGGALKVTWNEVATDDDVKSSQIAIPLKSLLLSPSGDIPSATKLPAYGEKQAIKEAILRMAELKPIKDEKNPNIIENPKSTSKTFDSSGGNTSGDSSLPSLEREEIDFSEPKETATYSMTTEGCNPRIDWIAEKVYPTSAQIKHLEGKDERVGDCTDSGIPYDIKYDFLSCSEKIDRTNKKVIPYKKAYYITASGEEASIKDCTADEKLFFQIEEEKGGCNDLVDMELKKATELYTLVYRNQANSRIVVDNCIKTESSTDFDITKKTCALRPDIDNNEVVIKEQYIYEKEGETKALTNCLDSENRLPLEWDIASCNSNIDFEKMTFTELARPMVEVEGTKEYLGVCMPLPTKFGEDEVLNTFPDTECVGMHMDYLDKGYSTGYVKYYQLINGEKRYLTECVEYPRLQYGHKQELISYIHDDSNYRSWAQYRTYVEVGESYKVNKFYLTPLMTDKTISIPYTTRDVRDVSLEQFTYNGCNKYERMQKVQTFRRVDKTEYFLEIEESTPKLIGDVCVQTQTVIQKSITENLSKQETVSKHAGVKYCVYDCFYKSEQHYQGNNYHNYICWSYNANQFATEIRKKVNPETKQTFEERGLTSSSVLPCKGANNATYCNVSGSFGTHNKTCTVR